MVLNLPDEGDGPVGRALVGPGAVAQRLREPVAELETALVAERDRVPTARFEDHQLVRGTAAHQMARSARAALLLDRADDGEAAPGAGRLPGYRGDGRRQRALRVDRAPSEETVALAAHRDESGDRVHVPEEHDLARSAAPEGDHVARFVPTRGESHAAQTCDQPLAQLALLRRQAGDLHHLLEQFDAGFGGDARLRRDRGDHAGTASSAPTRRT